MWVDPERIKIMLPTEYQLPPGGLGIRNPDPPLEAERRLHGPKMDAVKAFVRANGQMAYIREQDWFRSGTHEVVLRVESEFARQGDTLQWHKDTEGHTLFSNLMFFNDAGLPATEWTPDLQPMHEDKVAVLARNSHGFAALRFALARRGAGWRTAQQRQCLFQRCA